MLNNSYYKLFSHFFPDSVYVQSKIPPPIKVPIPNIKIIVSIFLIF